MKAKRLPARRAFGRLKRPLRKDRRDLGAITFAGKENRKATVVIRDRRLFVQDGHLGEPNLRLTVDSETWLGFLAKEKNIAWALLRRKFRLQGSPRLLLAFGKCFAA